MPRSLSPLLLIIAVVLLTVSALVPGPVFATPATAGFGFGNVVKLARKLAAKPYQKPANVPSFLGKLSESRYDRIRLKPGHWLWSDGSEPFQVGPIVPGYLYTHTVQLSVVDKKGAHPLHFNKSNYQFPSVKLRHRIPADLGFAGFQISYPFGGSENQRRSFMVFLGASYFRGIGAGEVYGTSARGIAVDTGLPSGEQFPRFTHYWLVKPSKHARSMTFYALLQGKSLTGAYRFTVWPGQPTRMAVKATLFMRKSVKLLGVAPLTSMFLYGANTPHPAGNWRPQVHDSGGLLIHDGSGEWLWRPLRNPAHLQTYAFSARNPYGFGLFQRETRFSMYRSLSARYDKRPSIWVQPDNEWGKGHVVLFEIPSKSHNNDNIVAFWHPGDTPSAGQQRTVRYTLTFGQPRIAREPLAHTASTRVGVGADTKHPDKAYRINVNFAGGPLKGLSPHTAVKGVVSTGNGGKVLSHYVQYVAPLHQWRLVILAQPAAGKALRLRAHLVHGGKTLTETWSYALPPDNGIHGGAS